MTNWELPKKLLDIYGIILIGLIVIGMNSGSKRDIRLVEMAKDSIIKELNSSSVMDTINSGILIPSSDVEYYLHSGEYDTLQISHPCVIVIKRECNEVQ